MYVGVYHYETQNSCVYAVKHVAYYQDRVGVLRNFFVLCGLSSNAY